MASVEDAPRANALQAPQEKGETEATSIPERTNKYTEKYAEACRDLAAREGLPVLDLWTQLQEYINWESTFLNDGVPIQVPCGSAAQPWELQWAPFTCMSRGAEAQAEPAYNSAWKERHQDLAVMPALWT